MIYKAPKSQKESGCYPFTFRRPYVMNHGLLSCNDGTINVKYDVIWWYVPVIRIIWAIWSNYAELTLRDVWLELQTSNCKSRFTFEIIWYCRKRKIARNQTPVGGVIAPIKFWRLGWRPIVRMEWSAPVCSARPCVWCYVCFTHRCVADAAVGEVPCPRRPIHVE